MAETCPKCGYAEVETDECPRCRVIISRYRAGDQASEGSRAPEGKRSLKGYVLAGLFLVVICGGLVAVFLASDPSVALEAHRIGAAHRESRWAIEEALRYQRKYGRNPGGIARLIADLPQAEILETDPWGRPWVVSPAFQDMRTPSANGDLWICSRGPSGTGPCAGPGDGSIGYSRHHGGWKGWEAAWRTWLYEVPAPLLFVWPWVLPLGYVMWCLGIGRLFSSPPPKVSRRMLTVLCLAGIVGTLSAMAGFVYRDMSSGCCRMPPGMRAAWDTKTAVLQAIVYANDKGAYPTSLKVLRESGYANIPDRDPWANPYMLSPVFTQGSAPREDDDLYVYSKGRAGTGMYPSPFAASTGEVGSIGYSSLYGSWKEY